MNRLANQSDGYLEAAVVAAEPGTRRLARSARKYAKIVRISLTERLTYRGDFILSTFLRFLPMLTTILLWEAIYDGSGKEELSGFRRDEMIAYLLLVHVSRMFSSMPGLAAG